MANDETKASKGSLQSSPNLIKSINGQSSAHNTQSWPLTIRPPLGKKQAEKQTFIEEDSLDRLPEVKDLTEEEEVIGPSIQMKVATFNQRKTPNPKGRAPPKRELSASKGFSHSFSDRSNLVVDFMQESSHFKPVDLK